jgi:hypothetical protein
MAEKSNFVLRFDDSATEVNRRPNLKGSYQLEADTMTHDVSLWGGVSQSGTLYARGRATPQSASDAMRGRATVENVEGPPRIDLKVGEAVIFENPKATPENRQPKYYGYAREPNQYVKLSGSSQNLPQIVR